MFTTVSEIQYADGVMTILTPLDYFVWLLVDVNFMLSFQMHMQCPHK